MPARTSTGPIACEAACARITSARDGAGSYRGARGLDPHIIDDIKKLFGFDKPPLTRFLDMVGGYLRFDFGRSFFRDQTLLQLILQNILNGSYLAPAPVAGVPQKGRTLYLRLIYGSSGQAQ